jgi:serine/threonine protein kinase
MQRSVEVRHTYTIEEELYSRGIARGCRARDEQLEDLVILEVVPIHEDTPERREFLRRYRSIAVKIMRMRHPNIVAIRDFVVHPEHFFVVKQYDSGLTLNLLLLGPDIPSLDPWVRASLSKDILRGLAVLHQSNIIHRDVKAYGIYVKDIPEYVAQLDYFPAAVSAEAEYLDSDLCGTPVYMAPEIIESPHLYTKQSDVYAAGLLLVEVLSGRSVQDLMRLDGFEWSERPAFFSYVLSRGGHVSESCIRASVPSEFADLLVRATKTNRADRFADCQAFYESFADTVP